MTTDNPTVGQTVYADLTAYGANARTIVASGEVVKVSPTGVIRVKFATKERSFQPGGLERGADWRMAARLIDQTEYERLRPIMIAERRQHRAHDAIRNVGLLPCNADNKGEIIKLLRIAMAAVEAL